ncbi:MAG: hypothetical protein QNJ97_07455 [Myxococcota bacterium]|nr:hypothetical protein [Myxococcota bacterium]
MENRLILLFLSSFLSIIAICIILWLSSDKDEQSIQPESKQISAIILKNPKNKSREKKEYWEKLGQLKMAIEKNNRLKGEKANDEEMDEKSWSPLDDYTDEEIEEIKDLHSKTNKIFFEKAPETLEHMMQKQKVNTEWTEDIENIALSDDMQRYMADNSTTLKRVDCRERICKIVFSHDKIDKYESFMKSNMDEGPWMTGSSGSIGSYKIDETGAVESFIYFTQSDDPEFFLDVRREMVNSLES